MTNKSNWRLCLYLWLFGLLPFDSDRPVAATDAESDCSPSSLLPPWFAPVFEILALILSVFLFFNLFILLVCSVLSFFFILFRSVHFFFDYFSSIYLVFLIYSISVIQFLVHFNFFDYYILISSITELTIYTFLHAYIQGQSQDL